MQILAVPNDALLLEHWSSLAQADGSLKSPYLDMLRIVESCDQNVVLDLTMIDSKATSTQQVDFFALLDTQYSHGIDSQNAPNKLAFRDADEYLLRLNLERSLGWFVDQVFVLQATNKRRLSVNCVEAVANWLGPTSYTPWSILETPQNAFATQPQNAIELELVGRWFNEKFPYHRDTLPDVVGLFRVGINGGRWPPPDGSTFQWRFHVKQSSIELHWVFDTGQRMGDEGQYCIVREGVPAYSDFGYDDPPDGWDVATR